MGLCFGVVLQPSGSQPKKNALARLSESDRQQLCAVWYGLSDNPAKQNRTTVLKKEHQLRHVQEMLEKHGLTEESQMDAQELLPWLCENLGALQDNDHMINILPERDAQQLARWVHELDGASMWPENLSQRDKALHNINNLLKRNRLVLVPGYPFELNLSKQCRTIEQAACTTALARLDKKDKERVFEIVTKFDEGPLGAQGALSEEFGSTFAKYEELKPFVSWYNFSTWLQCAREIKELADQTETQY